MDQVNPALILILFGFEFHLNIIHIICYVFQIFLILGTDALFSIKLKHISYKLLSSHCQVLETCMET